MDLTEREKGLINRFREVVNRKKQEEKMFDFIRCMRNLVNGSSFDLRDSPKSFIGTVERLLRELDSDDNV